MTVMYLLTQGGYNDWITNILNYQTIKRLAGFTDPGGYPSGNYCGQCNESGVHSGWLQIDAGTLQFQIKVTNGTNSLSVRCKFSAGVSWDGINWVEK